MAEGHWVGKMSLQLALDVADVSSRIMASDVTEKSFIVTGLWHSSQGPARTYISMVTFCFQKRWMRRYSLLRTLKLLYVHFGFIPMIKRWHYGERQYQQYSQWYYKQSVYAARQQDFFRKSHKSQRKRPFGSNLNQPTHPQSALAKQSIWCL